MGRSILAVVAGFVAIFLVATGIDLGVKAALPGYFDANGRTDHVGILLLTLTYVGLAATAGCYLAARLAPSNPMRHALILGGLGLLFNIAGSVAMWDTAPAWYHAAGLLTTMLWAWLGGRIRERQLASSPGARSMATA